MRFILIIVVIFFIFKWYTSEDRSPSDIVKTLAERVSCQPESRELRKKERDPETMTPEQRQMAMEWGNGGKTRYVARAEELESRVNERMAGGYVWGEDSARRVRSALKMLNHVIDRDDYLSAPKRLEDAEDAVRLFEAGCRWCAGLRHSRYSHISSANREGYWNADSGWIFPDQGSLEVARVCQHCAGSGQEKAWVDCDNCNGTGWVDGPLAGVTRFLDNVSSALDGAASAMNSANNAYRAAKGKRPKGGPPPRHRSPSSSNNGQVPCNQCNQSGSVEILQPCRRCGGRGWNR